PAYAATANSWLHAGRPDLAVARAEQSVKLASTVEAWSTLALAQFRYQLSLPSSDRSWRRFEQSLETLEKASAQVRGARGWQMDSLRADYLVMQGRSRREPAEGMSAVGQLLQSCEKKYAG